MPDAREGGGEGGYFVGSGARPGLAPGVIDRLLNCRPGLVGGHRRRTQVVRMRGQSRFRAADSLRRESLRYLARDDPRRVQVMALFTAVSFSNEQPFLSYSRNT